MRGKYHLESSSTRAQIPEAVHQKATSPGAKPPGLAGRLPLKVVLVAGQHGLLRHQMLDIDPEPFSNPASITRVCFQKVPNLFFLNALRSVPQAPDDIADQALLRIRLHQAEEIPQHKTLFEKSVGQDASG